jgi:hypothetical protein
MMMPFRYLRASCRLSYLSTFVPLVCGVFFAPVVPEAFEPLVTGYIAIAATTAQCR